MKAPRVPVTKLLLAKGGPSPHRARRRVERDNIPIHQQQFPTKQSLRASGNLVTEPSLEIIDPVPIHRENFPIPLPSSDINSMDWDDEDFEENEEILDFHLGPKPAPRMPKTLIPATPAPPSAQPAPPSTQPAPPSTQPAPPSSAQPAPPPSTQPAPPSTQPAPPPCAQPAPPMPSAPPAKPTLSTAPTLPPACPVLSAEPNIQPATQAVAAVSDPPNNGGNAIPEEAHNAIDPDWDSRIQSRTAASRAIFPRPAPSSRRVDKKIRGLEEYMGYYLSTGNAPMEAPPHLEDAELGDVFVHSNEDASKHQVWMRTADMKWERISAGYNHPYLLGYRLLLKNGKPAWVTKKTIATYHYRK